MKCPSTISLPGGCSWTGPTAGLENHLPHCDMKIVECNFKGRGCILRSYQRELAQHLLICPHRTEKCPSCGVDVPHSDQTGHDELCVRKLVPCPNNCGIQVERQILVNYVLLLMGATCVRQSSFALYLKCFFLLNPFHSFFFRCKMLSHLAFVCSKEGQPCPLYAVGCTEVHSLADSDSSSHLKLLLEARVSGACGVSLYSNDLVSKYPSMNIPFNKYLSLHMSSCKPTTFKALVSCHSRGNGRWVFNSGCSLFFVIGLTAWN